MACGFERADVIICVGYDMVEYHPDLWNPGKEQDRSSTSTRSRRGR